jgi:hypothetical protein
VTRAEEPDEDGGGGARRRPGADASLLRGGARGIALVTLATLALAAAGALISLVVSLLY